jgi:glutamate-5-semialdehyde dehydrogenase
VPIGVIGIIYESRPNVTADVAALCLKTANAVILRGGIDAMHSNRAILHALLQVKMPEYAMQLITIPDRDAIKELVQLTGKVDLIIPRGGEGLIKTVVDLAKVPVIKHYQGICHVYVDVDADLNKALAICENAKCQRPGVCNAMETLLVHEKIATQFLPKIAKILTAQQVKLKGDAKTQNIIPNIEPATAQDWETEYLDLILSIKVVTDINEAIQHINYYGSHHSDAIITENKKTAERFTTEVDSAAVYVNASTRFTDGAEFGMGAEMGISTDKLHARGPMGLEELTTYKYVILGTGQIRN